MPNDLTNDHHRQEEAVPDLRARYRVLARRATRLDDLSLFDEYGSSLLGHEPPSYAGQVLDLAWGRSELAVVEDDLAEAEILAATLGWFGFRVSIVDDDHP